MTDENLLLLLYAYGLCACWYMPVHNMAWIYYINRSKEGSIRGRTVHQKTAMHLVKCAQEARVIGPRMMDHTNTCPLSGVGRMAARRDNGRLLPRGER